MRSPPEDEGRFTLCIERSMAGLQRLGGWVDQVSAALGLACAADYALRLCAEEAAANLVMHGKDGAAGEDRVTLRVADAPDGLRLVVEDRCAAFDPLAVPPPEMPRNLEDARVGGMGIHLMRQQTRAIRYERVGDVNRLTLTIGRG